MGIKITIIFSIVFLAIVLRYTAMHTRKLHRTPKIKALVNEYDILLVAILTRESDKRFFIGVLIIKSEIKSAPERFPRYTINQFFNTCLRLAFFSMREIIKRDGFVDSSFSFFSCPIMES